jgi:AcrR family transcriptional regulator
MTETDRRAHLVAAAGAVFLEKGYRAATMDDIAHCACMSKKTLYQVFAGKTELFDALLTEFFAPVTIPLEADGRPPRLVLADVLFRLVDFALSDRQVAMLRLFIAEAPLSDDIAQALDRQGFGRDKGTLGKWLTAEAARGTVRLDDPETAASALFHAVAGEYLLGMLLRMRERPSAEEIAMRVETAVGVFFSQVG